MRLRYWIADAKSGTVLGEVRPSGSSNFSSKLGGGTCGLTVSLSHLTTLDGRQMDAAAVVRTMGFLTGGRRTVVVTDHAQRCLGEWLLMQRVRASGPGTATLRGMEWDGYPALRSLNANYKDAGTEQLLIARVLLEDAFRSFNAGMQIAIPNVTSGVGRNLDYKSHSAYYSDVLDEISAPDDGFEWAVEITPSWDGSQLVSVSRAVVFGHPVLARASDVRFELASPGSRRGTAVSIDGGDDFARYAQSVYGIGAGSGEKQRWVGLSDPTLTNAGYLNSTKNVTFSGVSDMATLTALTQGALSAAQDLRDPFVAVGFVDKLAALPRKGTRVQLVAEPTWAWPEGLDEQVRVGEVSFSPSGYVCEHVKIQAI